MMLDMCTSTASYTGSEGEYKYIIDSMNTAYVYLDPKSLLYNPTQVQLFVFCFIAV